MEPPVSLDGEDIRNEKVNLLLDELCGRNSAFVVVSMRSFVSGQGSEVNP